MGYGPALVLVLAGCLAAQIPTGFSVDNLSFDLDQPVGFDFVPDGRIIVAEQVTASIKVFAAGAIGTLGTVPGVNASSFLGGVLSVAVDPGWPARPYVYVYFSNSSPADLRLVMFTVTGNLANPASTDLRLGSPYVVLDGIPDQCSANNGGAARFGPDGMLYLSTGDDLLSPCNARKNDDLRGVVLRLDVSALPGSGGGPPPKSLITPAGNPFSGPNDNARLTFAYGLRNPFRFNIDSVTGHLFIADVGLSSQEEMNHGKGGENFGWPWFEGTRQHLSCGGSPPPITWPIATYGREGPGPRSIVSFGLYRNAVGGQFNFGNIYEGDCFFLDFFGGWVRRIKWNGSMWAPAPQVPGQPSPVNWGEQFILISDARVGQDGGIYFLLMLPGSLHRLRYTPVLPEVIAADTARAGKAFLVQCKRNPGDPVMLALGLVQIPPVPISGAFGNVEIIGMPVAGGAIGSKGLFDFNFPEIPVQAIGISLYFQCVVSTAGENYISKLKTVRVRK